MLEKAGQGPFSPFYQFCAVLMPFLKKCFFYTLYLELPPTNTTQNVIFCPKDICLTPLQMFCRFLSPP